MAKSKTIQKFSIPGEVVVLTEKEMNLVIAGPDTKLCEKNLAKALEMIKERTEKKPEDTSTTQ